jgi:DNA-binding transcriptional LysR family regulator
MSEINIDLAKVNSNSNETKLSRVDEKLVDFPPLIDRGPGPLRLTEAGRLLHERARGILGAVRETEAELDALRAGASKRVRLGCCPAAATVVVPRALRLFRGRLPSAVVAVREAVAAEVVAALRAGELDLGVVAVPGDAAREERGLVGQVLHRDRLMVALPERHPLATREALDAIALAERPLLGDPAAPELRAWAAASRAAGVEPRLTGWGVDAPRARLALVAAGEGLALVPGPGPLGELLPPGVTLRPLEGAPEWELRALRPAAAVLPVVTLAMLDAARAAVAPVALRRKALQVA